MRKKFQKKLNISNRNLYIKFFTNYKIFNYSHNYHLKFFFFFLKKKKYYFKYKLILNKNLKSSINTNILSKKLYLNFIKNSKNSTNNKNKFFNSNFTKQKVFQFNKELEINYSNKVLNNNILYNSNNNNYVSLTHFNGLLNLLNLYKGLMSVIYIYCFLKYLEIYKIVINLIYYNIKI